MTKSQAAGNHTVLIVGPVEEVAGSSLLARLPWRTQRASDCAGAALLLCSGSPRIVICERSLPGGSWKDVLDMANLLPCPPPVIVTSRLADERLWAEVLCLGGYDILAQPLDAEEVLRVADAAWQHWDTRRHAARWAKAATHIGRSQDGCQNPSETPVQAGDTE